VISTAAKSPGQQQAASAPRRLFPTTLVTVVREVAAPDAEQRTRAFETLTRVYWRPVCVYLRIKWQMAPEQAEDLTQEFFATAFAKRYFDVYLPSKGRFRTFLRVCVDRLVSKELQSRRRLKRVGDQIAMALPADEANSAMATVVADNDMEAMFDAEWIRALMSVSLEALRDDAEARGRTLGVTLFERLAFTDGRPPTYADLAFDYGIGVSDVTNQLARTRRRFREIVLDKLRDVTTTDEDFRSEARAVLGIDLA
jgi:DNA-directed RNA polymerase specialized sigma24 family protein